MMLYKNLAEKFEKDFGIALQLYTKSDNLLPYRIIVNADHEYALQKEESVKDFLIGFGAGRSVKEEKRVEDKKIRSEASFMIVALELGEKVRKVMIEKTYKDVSFWIVGYIDNKSDLNLDLENDLIDQINFCEFESAEIAFRNFKI